MGLSIPSISRTWENIKNETKRVIDDPGKLNPLSAQAKWAYDKMNPKAPPPEKKKQDPRITALRDKQLKEAKDFRTNLPHYEQEQMRPLAAEAEMQALEGVDNTRKNYNARGLLHSAYRANDEAQIQAQRAKTVAEQKMDINREAKNIANALDNEAASVGLKTFQDSVKNTQQAYDNAQAEALRRRQALASLGQGLGQGAGMAYSANRTPAVNGAAPTTIGSPKAGGYYGAA